jgi:hypothetical protein
VKECYPPFRRALVRNPLNSPASGAQTGPEEAYRYALGELTEIGLPQGDIPLALFAFNVGVEIGQLIFIGLLVGAWACAARISFSPALKSHALSAATYAIGTAAAFWFVERLTGFVT